MRWSRCMSLLPRTILHSDSEQGFWVLRNSPSLNLLLINVLTQDYLCYLQEKWLPMVSKNSLVLVISIGLYRGRRPKQQRPWLKNAKRICRSIRLKEKKIRSERRSTRFKDEMVFVETREIIRRILSHSATTATTNNIWLSCGCASRPIEEGGNGTKGWCWPY
jgi:hypothetical protein